MIETQILIFDKSDFHIYQFIAGYYGICSKFEDICIYGGENKHEFYSLKHLEIEFYKWSGKVIFKKEINRYELI